ncbi:MAG: hypothetical protein WB816_00965 [Methylocystis sp.]
MSDEVWTPQTVSALTGLGGVAVGALITWLGLGKRIAADQLLAQQKFDFDNVLAERKFNYDRDLHDHKRRVELAEQALIAFY